MGSSMHEGSGANRGRSSDLRRHGLDLDVVPQCFQTLLATEATILRSPEGCLDAPGEILVDEDLTGIDVPGQMQGAGNVARVDAGDQTEGGGVCQYERLLRGIDDLD